MIFKLSNVEKFKEFKNALEEGDVKKSIELLIKYPTIDTSYMNNYAIHISAKYGYIELVELLLKDKRVNPSSNNNYSMIWAYNQSYSSIVLLLWEDERVKKSLKNDDIVIYNSIMKKEIKDKVTKF